MSLYRLGDVIKIGLGRYYAWITTKSLMTHITPNWNLILRTSMCWQGGRTWHRGSAWWCCRRNTSEFTSFNQIYSWFTSWKIFFEKFHNRFLHTRNRAFLNSCLESYWISSILNHIDTGLKIKVWMTCPSEIYTSWTIVLVMCTLWTKWYRLPAIRWSMRCRGHWIMCWRNTGECTRFFEIGWIWWLTALKIVL